MSTRHKSGKESVQSGQNKKESDNGSASPTGDSSAGVVKKTTITNIHRRIDDTKKQLDVSSKIAETARSDIEIVRLDNERLGQENKELKNEVEMLKALVVKQSSEIDTIKRGLTDLQTRSMQCNILFHNVPESKGENCETKVLGLLREKSYEGDVVIDNIHRIGQYDKKATFPRPIVARLTNHKQVTALLKFGATLPKAANQFKVTPQFPAAVREKRRQLSEIAEEAKGKDQNVTTKIVADTLYINGERYVEKLPCPGSKELLYLSDAERKEALQTKFTESTVTEGGCTFIARSASAHSLNDVRALYKAVLLNANNLSASHNIAAYRLYTPLGAKTTAGYNDDGDFGMGRAARDILQKENAQNIAVFVTRFYGGDHLGPKRFRVVQDLVKSVLPK